MPPNRALRGVGSRFAGIPDDKLGLAGQRGASSRPMDDRWLRTTTSTEIDQLLPLHRKCSATPNSGLARHAGEIGRDSLEALPCYRNLGGISIVALLGEALLGEIHAARMPPRPFSHVRTDLMVAGQAQELSVGSRLFAALFETAARLTLQAMHIELVGQVGNAAAIRLDERLGL